MTTVTTTKDNSVSRPRGRLLFGLDATGSREPTWAIARDVQARMFIEAAPIGQLDVSLVFFGATNAAPRNGFRAAHSLRS